MNSCLISPLCVLTFLPCREVVTFNHFLEAAAEKEVQGKARLQDFIENLLQRVEVAEKQLEYYQSQQAAGLCRDIGEHMVSHTGPATKLWSLDMARPGPGQRKRELGNDLQEPSRRHLKALHQPCLCYEVTPGDPRRDPGCTVVFSLRLHAEINRQE